MGQRNADTRDGQRPDHHRPEGIGDLFTQTAIVAHVLFVVHRVDDRTGTKEQHRLKERVRQQVEHRSRVNPNARRHEHVAQLGTGRIGDHAFDVVLHQTDGRGEKRGGRTKEGDERHRLGRVFHQGRHAANQEDTGGHHGCGVDQSRHRRRALHRVGQPCVQQQLRRFTHRTNEQQEGQQVRRVPVAPQEGQVGFGQGRTGGKDRVEIHAVGQEEQAENPQSKAKVTHTVDDERFHRGGTGGRLFPVEPNQQVGRDAHTFPTKEHLDQVV